jgi:hypothetical protein
LTLTDLFKYLGAPLKNPRWSWGAVRPEDGTVVLRVWKDRTTRVNGKRYMQVTHRDRYKGDTTNPGNNEREGHIQRVTSGAKVIMVMCEVENPMSHPRDIKTFDKRDVFPGGQLIEADGDWWLELKPRITIQQARLTPP